MSSPDSVGRRAGGSSREQPVADAGPNRRRDPNRGSGVLGILSKEEEENRAVRGKILWKMQERLNRHMLAYVCSTREGLVVPMSMEAVPFICNHLIAIKKSLHSVPDALDETVRSNEQCYLASCHNTDQTSSDKGVALYLHSDGCDPIVAWRLVCLLRDYFKDLTVLVPHRALGGTALILLGADYVHVHPMGMVGPTYIRQTNRLNPSDLSDPEDRSGVHRSDLTAYVSMFKNSMSPPQSADLAPLFQRLAGDVDPLVLAQSIRSMQLTREIAAQMLFESRTHAVLNRENIINRITQTSPFCDRPIHRKELKQLGLHDDTFGATAQDVSSKCVDAELTPLMWELFECYERDLMLNDPFEPKVEFLKEESNLQLEEIVRLKPKTARLAIIEHVSPCRKDPHTKDSKKVFDHYVDIASVRYELIGRKRKLDTTAPDAPTVGPSSVSTQPLDGRARWLSQGGVEVEMLVLDIGWSPSDHEHETCPIDGGLGQ